MPSAGGQTVSVLAIVLAIAMVAVYLAILNAIDRYEKEPWTILLACVGLGAIVAPLIVVVILVLMRPRRDPAARRSRPGRRPTPSSGSSRRVTLGVLLIVLVHRVRDEFDDVLDGVIYGAAIGAGFGATESFLYALGGTGPADDRIDRAARDRGPQPRLLHGGLRGDPRLGPDGLPRAQRWIDHRARPRHRGLAPRLPRHAAGDPVAGPRPAGRRGRRACAGLVARTINWLGILTLAVVVVLSGGARRGSCARSCRTRSPPASSATPTTRRSPRSADASGASRRLLRTGARRGFVPPPPPLRDRGGARLRQVAPDGPHRRHRPAERAATSCAPRSAACADAAAGGAAHDAACREPGPGVGGPRSSWRSVVPITSIAVGCASQTTPSSAPARVSRTATPAPATSPRRPSGPVAAVPSSLATRCSSTSSSRPTSTRSGVPHRPGHHVSRAARQRSRPCRLGLRPGGHRAAVPPVPGRPRSSSRVAHRRDDPKRDGENECRFVFPFPWPGRVPGWRRTPSRSTTTASLTRCPVHGRWRTPVRRGQRQRGSRPGRSRTRTRPRSWS